MKWNPLRSLALPVQPPRAVTERAATSPLPRPAPSGREHVRQNSLITHHLREYIALLAQLVA